MANRPKAWRELCCCQQGQIQLLFLLLPTKKDLDLGPRSRLRLADGLAL